MTRAGSNPLTRLTGKWREHRCQACFYLTRLGDRSKLCGRFRGGHVIACVAEGEKRLWRFSIPLCDDDEMSILLFDKKLLVNDCSFSQDDSIFLAPSSLRSGDSSGKVLSHSAPAQHVTTARSSAEGFSSSSACLRIFALFSSSSLPETFAGTLALFSSLLDPPAAAKQKPRLYSTGQKKKPAVWLRSQNYNRLCKEKICRQLMSWHSLLNQRLKEGCSLLLHKKLNGWEKG